MILSPLYQYVTHEIYGEPTLSIIVHEESMIVESLMPEIL